MDERITIHSQIRGIIDDRFEHLRNMLVIWLQDMESAKSIVPAAFDHYDLEQIHRLMDQYHLLRRRVEDVQQFISRWEHNQSSIMNYE